MTFNIKIIRLELSSFLQWLDNCTRNHALSIQVYHYNIAVSYPWRCQIRVKQCRENRENIEELKPVIAGAMAEIITIYKHSKMRGRGHLPFLCWQITKGIVTSIVQDELEFFTCWLWEVYKSQDLKRLSQSVSSRTTWPVLGLFAFYRWVQKVW